MWRSSRKGWGFGASRGEKAHTARFWAITGNTTGLCRVDVQIGRWKGYSSAARWRLYPDEVNGGFGVPMTGPIFKETPTKFPRLRPQQGSALQTHDGNLLLAT